MKAPTTTTPNGDRYWYDVDTTNSKSVTFHSVDHPSIIFLDGTTAWYWHDDGYAFDEWADLAGIDGKTRTLLRLKYPK